jgi:ADP-ribosylglycohydrolase
MEIDREDRLAGVLLGTAVGDALGLPREGMSRRRALRMHGQAPLRHRFLFGRGMISDDTEHACMTAQALLAYPEEPRVFAKSLAWRLRFWLLGIPAGVGFGTLRAILKLWVGFPPTKSGVYSAGNGPAMRSPILGACLYRAKDTLNSFVNASTFLTHTDPKAGQGALAVALCAAYAVQRRPEEIVPSAVLSELCESLVDSELVSLLKQAGEHLEKGSNVEEFADSLGLGKGVSGYIYHTVPVAIFGWLRYRSDFCEAVESVILLGGDTDTTGAITGALAGATLGASGFPTQWLGRLFEWPRSVRWMCRLAANLTKQFPEDSASTRAGPTRLFWPGILPRNVLFLGAVLWHGFRRLFPPY